MNSKTLGNGKDIIFLHGWGASISAFLFVAKKLSKNFRVTLLDFAGFGDSEEPTHPYTVGDYANEVLELMNAKGIKEATFVGHSFGGRIALEIAANHPNCVNKLVLIDSAGLKPRRKLNYYVKIFIHKLLRKLGHKGLKGSSDFRQLTPVMKQTFKNVVNYDQSRLLPLIMCQTAIFWGKDDSETPPYMAKRLKKGIKNSELFWLEGGHFAYVEDLSKFYAILLAFLRSDKSPRTKIYMTE